MVRQSPRASSGPESSRSRRVAAVSKPFQRLRAVWLRAPWAQRPEGEVPAVGLLPGLFGACGWFGQRCWGVAGRMLISRNYAVFMGGSFFSSMGTWFMSVAIGWIVLELTNSPFYLGFASFARLMPVFFLGLLGGVLADRWDRRRILLVGVSANALALAVLAGLALAGLMTLPLLLGISLILGVANAAVQPAWQPFIKELVPEDRLREAIAINSARFNVTRVLGPALAGVVLAHAGAGVSLLIAAIGTVGVVVAASFIRRPASGEVARRAASRSVLGAIGEGLSFVRGDRFVARLLLITGAFGLLVMPYQSFLPAFARDILGIGAGGLGALLASVGVGAVGGALLTSTKLVSRRPGVAMAVAALLTGVALMSFATTPAAQSGQPWRAYASLVAVGMGATGYLTASNATLQLRVPEHLIGRVMGLWVTMNAGMMPLGGLVLGAVSERYGLPPVLFWCGMVGVGLGGLALVTRAFTGSREHLAARARADRKVDGTPPTRRNGHDASQVERSPAEPARVIPSRRSA